jgi:anti-sigma factor RsiW
VTHDPMTVAAYVAGELTGGPHAEFEKHLLACEACWKEVEVGRRGRQLVALAREPAPDALRERLLMEFDDRSRRRPRLARLVAVAIAAAAAVAAIAVGVVFAVQEAPPASINAAVADFRAARLPGSVIPTTTAPDLTKIGLTQTAAGAGDLAGIPVTAYAYRDRTGRRLLIYVGQQPFVTPRDAKEYAGSDAWISHQHGVSVLCSREPHVTLVVGEDEEQVTHTAEFLDLT